MAERQLKMTRSRVFSFVSQLPGFRDSHSRSCSVSSSVPPVSPTSSTSPTLPASPASSAATSPSSTPPSSSPPTLPHTKSIPSSTTPLPLQRPPPTASFASSPDSTTEPFPEIHPSHFPVNAPPTPPNDSDYDCSGGSSPIEPIPEDDGVAPLVNVSRSNSGQRASWSGNSGAVGTTTTTGRQRSYSIASNYSGRERSSSRPTSIVQTYQPHVMDITEDTPAELQPTFTFLNNHGSKLYQEGYFLKLDDQNAQGRANSDRTWHECFAQLVGTVLSLWDAAELDAAGEDGEVLPKFINITDASIKMIESLKMSTDDSQVLQNILSISTAGRNRYLLHFNSHHSLVQWTSAIRLAMYEHSSLQEAYTGALIAGKARALNNINIIMERATVPSEEWVRVRFGAGVPWRRCWCVITPPSVKELGKAQKEMKKRSPYDRSVPVLKGDIKFYDTRFEGRKLKKAKPIATITDAFAAYAIYPQAKALIDASTLIKVEGDITIHSDPPCSNEGFVFIMPEVHPAVSGFETLLKFLFPVWDTFALYGRPGKLVASPLDSRALMFAMPRHKRYGYLEILDVSGLVTTSGCDSWNDREWRKRLKDLTGQRRAVMDEASGVAGGESRSVSRAASRRSSRASFGMGALPAPPKLRVGFSDANPANRGSRSFSLSTPTPPRLDTDSPSRPSDGPGHGLFKNVMSKHTRNSSDPEVAAKMSPQTAGTSTFPALDSPQRGPTPVQSHLRQRVDTNASEGVSSDDERSQPFMPALQPMPKLEAPAPVARPPKFNHDPSSRPLSIMYHSHETRRANNRLSTTTLSQLAKVGRVAINMDSTPDVTATGRMRAQESDAINHHPGRQNPRPGHHDDGGAPSTGAEPFPDLQNDFATSSHAPPPIPPMSGLRSQSPAPLLVPASMRPGPQAALAPPTQFAPPMGVQGRGFVGPGPPSPGMRGGAPLPMGGAPGARGMPLGPPSPGMRPPDGRTLGPLNPQFRSPSPGAPGFATGPMAHRPNPMAGPDQRMPLPQRTTSLQTAHGPVRSATADAVGIDRGRAHRQDSDLSGGWRPGARPERPQLGIPMARGDPDVVESPTDYIVSQWEWDRQQPSSSPAMPSFPGSRSQSPARMPSAPTSRSYTPQMQSPRDPERRMAPPQQPFSPEYAQHRVRTGSPGPGRAMSPDPRMLGSALNSPRAPPSLARSASYEVMDQPSRPFASPEIQRPGSSNSMRGGGAADHVMRGGHSPLVKLAGDGNGNGNGNMLQGLGLVERGGAQRAPAQTVFHHHAQPQRTVIVDSFVPQAQTARVQGSPQLPPSGMSPLLHPGSFSGSPLQSPHRSPVMSTSPKIPSPMSATFGHAGDTSPPQPPRGTSPRPQGRPMPPPQGQYSSQSRPVTPQLGPQYGQAF